MSANPVKTTPTYFPGSKINFVLSNFEEDKAKAPKRRRQIKFNDSDSLVKAGLADGCKKNSSFRDLIEAAKICELSNRDIMSNYDSYISSIQPRKSEKRPF